MAVGLKVKSIKRKKIQRFLKKDERVKRKKRRLEGKHELKEWCLFVFWDAKQAWFLAKVRSLPREIGRTQIQPGFLKILESIESMTSVNELPSSNYLPAHDHES